MLSEYTHHLLHIHVIPRPIHSFHRYEDNEKNTLHDIASAPLKHSTYKRKQQEGKKSAEIPKVKTKAKKHSIQNRRLGEKFIIIEASQGKVGIVKTFNIFLPLISLLQPPQIDNNEAALPKKKNKNISVRR